jgi:hypothetical protein
MKRIGFLSIAVAGIVACRADRALPPSLSADIQDATHSSGNSFFFWLPPTVNQQAPSSQVFSRDLRPVVTIVDQGPADAPSINCHAGNTVRTFSGSDITVSNAAYHVNWQTDLDNLHPECTYRIKVDVGQTHLGFADVDVVSSGNQLKNVNTNEFIALVDGRTLPITFFIGVGSTCNPLGGADCGEGTAKPGENTTIVTTSGKAGVFIPAGAVNSDVTITIQSVDERFDGSCIPRLLQEFPGTPKTSDNGCYDYRADPPLAVVNDNDGTFNAGHNATVGICPPANAMSLDHAVLDLLQVFRFDNVGDGITTALENVPAPFLQCDPHFSPSFGSRRSLLDDVAQALASVISPRPLYASAKRTMFDLGAGGSTDGFSRFAWALPSAVNINFDLDPHNLPVAPGTLVNTLYSRLGVTFSRSRTDGLCPGTGVYANDNGPGGFNSGQNNITLCPEGVPSDFSHVAFGDIIATFTIPVAEACVTATPLGLRGLDVPGVAFLEAFDASGNSLGRFESSTARTAQALCGSADGIKSVRFAGADAGFAVFDNVFFAPRLPVQIE